MSEKTSTNREALVKAAAAVRPALATQAFIPALQHILFDGNFATAYNDIAAISVRCKADVERLLPGELLIKALGAFGAEQIIFQEGKDGALVLSSGRSKLTLPTLAPEAFPLVWPKAADGDEIELDHSILKGIERCLISVGNDPTHPAMMGHRDKWSSFFFFQRWLIRSWHSHKRKGQLWVLYEFHEADQDFFIPGFTQRSAIASCSPALVSAADQINPHAACTE